MFIKAECQTGAVVMVVMFILGLQQFISRWCWAWPWLRKTVATAFEVVCGWSVASAVFLSYDVIINMRRHQSIHCLLVANLPQLTWCTSRHLTRRLCVISKGPWGGNADNFCVWIVRNCCPNYLKYEKNYSILAKNHVWIIREVELLQMIR